MSVKGRPKKKLTPAQRKVFLLLPIEDRPLYLKRLRGRAWVAERRKADPEKYRKACREWKRAQTPYGYHRVGGKGYRGAVSSEKRKAYWRNYYWTVRVLRTQSTNGKKNAPSVQNSVRQGVLSRAGESVGHFGS